MTSTTYQIELTEGELHSYFRRMKIPFQALIEQITGYAIVILDSDGIIQSWNAGARAITGYTDREAVGRPLSSFVGGGLVSEALKAGQASTQCWLLRKGGAPLWTQSVLQVVNETGGARALCWMCQDPFDNQIDMGRHSP